MNITELKTPYETHRAVMYNKEGTKALYHNRKMRHMIDSLYIGERMADSYGQVFYDVYALFDGVKVAYHCWTVHDWCDVPELLDRAKREHVDTLKNMLSETRRRIEKQDHIPLVWLEFIRQVKPEFESAMWESRKAFAERQQKRHEEERRIREEEDAAFVAEKNAEAQKIVASTVEKLEQDGKIYNADITFYKSRYESHTVSVLLYLCKQYGIEIPIRTQGWINNNLTICNLKNGKIDTFQYMKTGKQGGASSTFHQYIDAMISAVRSGGKFEPAVAPNS